MACVAEPTPIDEGTLAEIQIISGDQQTGTAHQQLDDAIVAVAITRQGLPDVTRRLWVRIVSGNGTIQAGGATAAGNGATLPGRKADGTISVLWWLGEAGQAQELRLFAVHGDTVWARVVATAVPVSDAR